MNKREIESDIIHTGMNSMKIDKYMAERQHRQVIESMSLKKEVTTLEEGVHFLQDNGKIHEYIFIDDLLGNKYWGYISTETHNLYDIYTPSGLVKHAAYRSVDEKKKKVQTRKIRSAKSFGKLYFHVTSVSIRLKKQTYGVIVPVDRKKSNYVFEFDKKFLDSERKRLDKPLIRLQKTPYAKTVKTFIDKAPVKNAVTAKSVGEAIHIVEQTYNRKRPRPPDEPVPEEFKRTLRRIQKHIDPNQTTTRKRLREAIKLSRSLEAQIPDSAEKTIEQSKSLEEIRKTKKVKTETSKSKKHKTALEESKSLTNI